MPGPNKYKAKRCQYGNSTFDSQGEATCYLYLLAKQQQGEIKILGRQEKVYLTDAKILYKADFVVFDVKRQTKIYVEYKGFETTDWKLKKRLWRYYGPGVLQIYKGKVHLEEEIIPLKSNSPP